MPKSQLCSLTWGCSALLLALWAPVTAFACDTSETATAESSCVVIKRGGVQGVWFDLKTSSELRGARRLIPELELQIGKFEQVEAKRGREAADLRKALQLTKESLNLIESAIATNVKQARVARQEAASVKASADRWKWVWWGAGIATGALTAVLVSQAVD